MFNLFKKQRLKSEFIDATQSLDKIVCKERTKQAINNLTFTQDSDHILDLVNAIVNNTESIQLSDGKTLVRTKTGYIIK